MNKIISISMLTAALILDIVFIVLIIDLTKWSTML
jgi:hypothetical protein